MTTKTATLARPFPAYTGAVLPSGPLLVASDLSGESDAAYPIAARLALQTGADVEIVSVLPPYVMPMYGFDAVPIPVEVDAGYRTTRAAALLAQQRRLVKEPRVWSTAIISGEPGRETTERARLLNARLIIAGRGRHAIGQRLLGGETVLRMLQLGDTPVLAVAPSLTELPHRVVIATDFSDFSEYAARVALPLMAPDAHVTLMHVAPVHERGDSRLDARALAYREESKSALARLRARLGDITQIVDDVVVEGSPTEVLVEYVVACGADLVVSATHGYGFFRRMVLGSTAAGLLRRAPCSILVVPGSAQVLAATRARTASSAWTRSLLPHAFDAELAAFAVRNAARRTTVEIVQNGHATRTIGQAMPLVSASYDAHDQAIALTFGSSTFGGAHLTHIVATPGSIDVMVDDAGREQAMRIVHPGGYTTLTLD